MTVRLSSEITQCVRNGRYLLAAFETEGHQLSTHFHDFTRPHLREGDASPGVDSGTGDFLVAIQRSLESILSDLEAKLIRV